MELTSVFKRIIVLTLLWSFICTLLLPINVAALEEEKPTLTFGVFAYLGEEETREIYQPIADYLNSQLIYERIELKVLPMADIEKGIADQSLDIVTTNPTHFLVIRKDFPLTGVIATLVSKDSGKPISQLGGAIFSLATRQDINTLSDIRGKAIGTPSFNHMGGYTSQAYELYLAGIHLPKDAKKIVELGIHQEVVHAVLRGEVDVGFVREGILEHMTESGVIAPDQIKVINPQNHLGFPYQISTRLYPQWPVFALPHVDERSVRHVAAALFALESDHPAAEAAGIYGYTIPRDYLPVEELSRALRIPPFDAPVNFTPSDVWERWKTQLLISGLGIGVILLLSAGLVILVTRLKKSNQQTRDLLRQLDEEINKAMAIHKNNFPLMLPAVEGMSITAYYQPAYKMGGDYYDVLKVHDKLVFYVSDVSGHSLDGAMMSVFVKNTVRDYLSLAADHEIAPAKIIEYVYKQYNKENYPEDYFICLFVGIIDLKNLHLSYLGSGLQFPSLCITEGTPVELVCGGLPISNAYPISVLNLKEEQLKLTANTTIIIYTDGLIEEELNGEQYGTDRLKKVLLENYSAKPELIKDKINNDFISFTGTIKGQDDITYLILKTI